MLLWSGYEKAYLTDPSLGQSVTIVPYHERSVDPLRATQHHDALPHHRQWHGGPLQGLMRSRARRGRQRKPPAGGRRFAHAQRAALAQTERLSTRSACAPPVPRIPLRSL